MRLHAGTHIDSPEHWVEGGKPIDQLPLSMFMGEAIVADLTDKNDKAITEKDLDDRVGGMVSPGARLLIRTGWNDRFFGLPHKDGPMGLAEWKKDSPYFTSSAIA
jgi:kynurenine formamidase